MLLYLNWRTVTTCVSVIPRGYYTSVGVKEVFQSSKNSAHPKSVIELTRAEDIMKILRYNENIMKILRYNKNIMKIWRYEDIIDYEDIMKIKRYFEDC